MHRLDRLHLDYPFAGSRMLIEVFWLPRVARSALGM